MSQQHIDIWNQAAAAFDQRYEAIAEAQWAEATPCEGWNVKDLVDHAVGTQKMMGGGMVGAEIGEDADWPTARDAISTALAAEGALDGMTEFGPMGEVPKAMVFGIGTTDLLLHAWDLARAIGADEQLPAEAVSAAYQGLQRFPEEARLAEGRFAPSIPVADDADEQTKLIMFSGRQV
ncbi:MAG: TIGR03086 family metal-binding protein [Acidimicrobiales bacterium]